MPTSPRRRLALRAAGTLLGLALVLRLLAEADLARSWDAVVARGPVLLLVLLPFLLGMVFDTAAWKLVLRDMGAQVAQRTLLPIRVATEAFVMTVPGGSVLAEVWKPILLLKVLRIDVAVSTASVAAKKALYLVSNAAYLALGLAGGWALLVGLAQALGATAGLARWLPVALSAIVVALGAMGLLLGSALGKGTLARRMLAVVRPITPRRIRPRLDGLERGLGQVDDAARSFFAGGVRATALPVTLLFLQWLTEASETYLMLRLLGVDAGFLPVVAFEALNSLLRAAAFALPAGLGVQETGQLLLLKSLGVPDAATLAAALLLLKRGKDVVWSLTGYGLLAGMRAPRATA